MGVPTKADMFICDGHTYQSWHVRLRWGNPVLAAHSMHAEEIQRNAVHSQHLEVTQESVSSSGCEAETSTRCGTHYPDRAGLEQNPCCLEDRGSLTSGCGGRITLDRTLRVSANNAQPLPQLTNASDSQTEKQHSCGGKGSYRETGPP